MAKVNQIFRSSPISRRRFPRSYRNLRHRSLILRSSAVSRQSHARTARKVHRQAFQPCRIY